MPQISPMNWMLMFMFFFYMIMFMFKHLKNEKLNSLNKMNMFK